MEDFLESEVRNFFTRLSTFQKCALLGKDLYVTLFDKAAVYLYHIVKNHPFNDGNKRTGAGAALMFLRANGKRIRYDRHLFVELVVDVASGQADKNIIRDFLKESSLSGTPASSL